MDSLFTYIFKPIDKRKGHLYNANEQSGYVSVKLYISICEVMDYIMLNLASDIKKKLVK